MGYYTYHNLSIKEGHDETMSKDDELAFHQEEISKIVGYNVFEEESKWYDHEEDMKKYSKKYPNKVFCIYGDGEETEDIWYQYFKNGKTQICPVRFEFDKYDENKLE